MGVPTEIRIVEEIDMAPMTAEKLNTYLRTVAILGGIIAAGVTSWYANKDAIRAVDAKLETHLAVDAQDAEHIREALVRIETDVKGTEAAVNEIRRLLMNPVR